MNNYWQNFYKSGDDTLKPTDFVKTLFDEGTLNCIDLGCGNGRDTYYLGKQFKSVIGCDYAFKPVSTNKVRFFKEDLSKTLKRKCPDVVYSRFFLHCLTDKEIVDILKWTKDYFIAEFRVKGDKPILYKHKRNLIDPSWIVKQLSRLGFEYNVSVGRGLAKFKEEDPLVMRIYAKKIKI